MTPLNSCDGCNEINRLRSELEAANNYHQNLVCHMEGSHYPVALRLLRWLRESHERTREIQKSADEFEQYAIDMAEDAEAANKRAEKYLIASERAQEEARKVRALALWWYESRHDKAWDREKERRMHGIFAIARAERENNTTEVHDAE